MIPSLFRLSLRRRRPLPQRSFFFDPVPSPNTTDIAKDRRFPRRIVQNRFQVSVSSIRGMRGSMEDSFDVHQDGYAGVFDGHGGESIAQYLRIHLGTMLWEEVSKQQKMVGSPTKTQTSDVFRRAIAKVDHAVCQIPHWGDQGSTLAAVWFATPQQLVVAGVGDSRVIVACQDHHVHQLTRDHRPNCPLEEERIYSVGGRVELVYGVPRVNGRMGLSRAIGDLMDRPAISGEPDMAVYDINEAMDEFLILGTDGLFDVMSNEDCVDFVRDLMYDDDTNGEQREYFASLLVEEALRRGSYDNVTVIIIWLQ